METKKGQSIIPITLFVILFVMVIGALILLGFQNVNDSKNNQLCQDSYNNSFAMEQITKCRYENQGSLIKCICPVRECKNIPVIPGTAICDNREIIFSLNKTKQKTTFPIGIVEPNFTQ